MLFATARNVLGEAHQPCAGLVALYLMKFRDKHIHVAHFARGLPHRLHQLQKPLPLTITIGRKRVHNRFETPRVSSQLVDLLRRRMGGEILQLLI